MSNDGAELAVINDPTTGPGQMATSLKAYRTSRGMTLAQVSKASGISVGHLSRLENGERSPSVKVLLQLSRAFGVSLGELAGESVSSTETYVSLRSERTGLPTDDSRTVSLSDPRSTSLQALELALEPGRRGEPAAHLGEEWIHVLKGSVEVVVDGTVTVLRKGDAAHFRAEKRHLVQNPSSKPATVLVVSSMGSATVGHTH